MKVGLIGYGSIGKRHYENLLSLKAEVVVLSKRRGGALKERQVRQWREFAARGPFDAICIANETGKHLETIKRAFALTPKGIFVEKPLSADLKGVASIRALARKKNIPVFVGYCFQFFEPFLRIKRIIEQESLGKIYSLRAFAGQDLREWRKRDYRQSYSAKRGQGGVVLDLIHELNYPSWLLGERLVPRAALVRKISALEIDAEDVAESVLEGEKSGAIVSVHQDYLRTPGRRSLEISGSRGSLLWDSQTNEISTKIRGKTARKRLAPERNAMYLAEMRFFLGEIRRGKPVSNFDEAVRDLSIAEWLKKYGR